MPITKCHTIIEITQKIMNVIIAQWSDNKIIYYCKVLFTLSVAFPKPSRIPLTF